MARRRFHRAEHITGSVIIGAAVIILIGVIMLTQTNWGRRHVLAFGLDQLASRVHGRVTVQQIHGNLLSGARLDNVIINDTAGRPFLRADTVLLRYSFRSLLRRHVMLNDVKLVNATLVLDQPPGEEWNYARLFPVGPPKPNRGPGFGSWIIIQNMQVKHTTVVFRPTWLPPDLPARARERAIAQALSPDSRLWVVPVGNGYQSISEMFDVNGWFPLMRLADPDSTFPLIKMQSLSFTALPYRPPGVKVRSLSGRMVMTHDSLLFDSVRVATADSRGSGVGAYAMDGSGARVQLTLPQANFADARFLRPDAPNGDGHLQLAYTSHNDRAHIIASNMDVHVEGASIRGLADFEMGPRTFTVGPSNVQYADVSTRLVKKFMPSAPLQAPGTLTGSMRLTGSPAAMRVDGWTTYRERNGNTSRIVADGTVGNSRGDLVARGLHLRFQPLHLSLLRAYQPKVPYRGALTGTATLTGSTRSGFAVVADLFDADARAGRSRILANGRIEMRNGLTLRQMHLRFEPLQVAMLKPFAPTLPYGGTIAGTTTLTGSMQQGFNVVADLRHTSNETGTSHVTANGRIELAHGFYARALHLGFEPLQVAMIKPFSQRLPIDGTLVGTATVTGALTGQRLAATLDLEHHGSTGTSHLIGKADLNRGTRGFYDVDLRAPVLSLATVGQYAPQLGLQGTASGRIIARGSAASVQADINLAFPDSGGALHARGVFDLSTPLKRYDVTSTFEKFNAASALAHGPRTSLSGIVVARGSGTTAATANATLVANLYGSRAGNMPLVDTVLVDARMANGLATINQGHFRLSSGHGDFSGSFGLMEGRSGTLRYALVIDTLAHFIPHTADSGMVQPRPLTQARRIAKARVDSARIAQASEVQRAAVGYPPLPSLAVDTVLPVKRDTVAGSLRAEGTITGNVKQFDAKGTAEARNFTARGKHVGYGNASYSVTGFRTPNMSFHLDAVGDTISFSGFAFDSARAKVDYTGQRSRGNGTADIAVFQDGNRDYRLTSDFNLELDRKQVLLKTLAMRFDTTRWTAARPATVAWGKAGTTIANFDLRNNTGGYVRADGRLPTQGSADLKLDIEGLQVGDVTAMLQDTSSIEGMLGLHAHVQGTTSAPIIAGNFVLDSGAFRGQPLPDIKSTIDYGNNDLRSHTELFRGATKLATADAHVPVNLAFSGVTGPRLARNAPLQVDVRADSLPLEALPSFTTAVSEVRGRVIGNAAIRGTFDHPRVDGIAVLDLGQLRVTPSGVLYHDIIGTVRLRGDTAYVDSVIAFSAGSIRTSGTLVFTTLLQPSFDLKMVAQNATLVDNYRGRIRADANLQIKGPYAGAHVTGDATVTGGVMYPPETRNQRVTNLDDPTLRAVIDTAGLGLDILPPPNPFTQNLQVDVSLRINPGTWARNTQGNVEIYTPDDADPMSIHMDNAHQVLTLTGVINTDRGEYGVAGRNFQISTGSATFLPGPKLDPMLQLTARYDVQRKGLEALTIEVHVDGPMSKPRLTLASNSQPPLAQSDLLSYLAFGQPSSSLLNSGSTAALGVGNGGLGGIPALAQQQLASVAMGATIDQMVAEIEREGSSRAGLDVFRVHAGEMPAEATFQGYFSNFIQGTEFEAGKYVAPRFFVEARGRMTTTPGILLQYRGRNGLQWTGAWEPRYLPVQPSFETTLSAARRRSLGVFLLWTRRF